MEELQMTEQKVEKTKKEFPKKKAVGCLLWVVAILVLFVACAMPNNNDKDKETDKPKTEAKADDMFKDKEHMEYILFKKVDSKWERVGSDKFLLEDMHDPIKPQEPGTYRRDWKSFDVKGAISEQHTGEVFTVK
jgi:hypothetical protein